MADGARAGSMRPFTTYTAACPIPRRPARRRRLAIEPGEDGPVRREEELRAGAGERGVVRDGAPLTVKGGAG
jgi:hypothetical protein